MYFLKILDCFNGSEDNKKIVDCFPLSLEPNQKISSQMQILKSKINKNKIVKPVGGRTPVHA
jgi:hypothetical protein